MQRISNRWGSAVLACVAVATLHAAEPPQLVLDRIPPVPDALRKSAAPYLNMTGMQFLGWHPQRREMLIATRLADQNATQLHLLTAPDAKPRALTAGTEPTYSGTFQPPAGKQVLFAQDKGGNEVFQLARLHAASPNPVPVLLTDGISRHTSPKWSRDGQRLAFMSPKRTGKDNDLYVMDPAKPDEARLLAQLTGGGWGIADWSPQGEALVLIEHISINESYLHLVDAGTGRMSAITPRDKRQVARGGARFGADLFTLFYTADADSDFQQLYRLDLKTGIAHPLTPELKWDIEDFEVSPNGKTIALVINEGGFGRLQLFDTATAKLLPAPKLPEGIVTNPQWRADNLELGFSLQAADSPGDAFAYHTGTGRLERWITSALGGLDVKTFVKPTLEKVTSFDGRIIPMLVYLPDAKKFPNPAQRPVLINVHGGPEGQSRPGFLRQHNYFLNELGIALVYPNVRGSSGYGRQFLLLDNGMLRQHVFADMDAVLNWIFKHERLDGDRVAVMGGSYGGFMALGCMVKFNSFLRCGVDVVGISNFVTFLNNTEAYRRDLRRVEYGDERDPKMREFLQGISPLNHVAQITRPLFVVQGANDPRVPATESQQMVNALRAQGNEVWYLLAKDEGHGFRKKANADRQFLATLQFLQQHLLDNPPAPKKPAAPLPSQP